MKKKLISVELADGTIHENLRIIYADQVALESTAKNRAWDIAAQSNKAAGFLAWHAIKRNGLFGKETPEFAVFEAEQLVDYDVTETEAPAPEDPTQAGA